MKIKEIHYPYPVLTPYADDITGKKFEADLTYRFMEGIIQFNVDMQLYNKTLLSMIGDGEAVYAIQVSCHSTLQRFLFTTNQLKYSFFIDEKMLNGTAYVNFFVLAARNIEQYENVDFHEDYEGISFKIEKGDRLAVANTIQLEIVKEPIVTTNSIFQLLPSYEKDSSLFYVEHHDKIRIWIPAEVHSEIQYLYQYGTNYNTMLISLYYVPALVETLYHIRELIRDNDLDEVEDTDWFKSIAHRLNVLNISIYELDAEVSLTSVALKILENPHQRSVKLLENQWEEE